MPKNEPASAATVEINSPDFRQAVADAVARAMAGSRVPLPSDAGFVAAPRMQTVTATSIDTSQPGPDDLTVRFNRFCSFNGCGYQRDQEAGFPRRMAEEVHRSGAGSIVYDPRRRG